MQIWLARLAKKGGTEFFACDCLFCVWKYARLNLSPIIGVIESPETLKCIARTFSKALIWYLLKYAFDSDRISERLEKKRKETTDGNYLSRNIF